MRPNSVSQDKYGSVLMFPHLYAEGFDFEQNAHLKLFLTTSYYTQPF